MTMEYLYNVYHIVNPQTNEPFYVGSTRQTLSQRLYGHIHTTGEYAPPVSRRIHELLSVGIFPKIELLEQVVAGSPPIEEIEWIQKYIEYGYEIMNVLATPIGYDIKSCMDGRPIKKVQPITYDVDYSGLEVFSGSDRLSKLKYHRDRSYTALYPRL